VPPAQRCVPSKLRVNGAKDKQRVRPLLALSDLPKIARPCGDRRAGWVGFRKSVFRACNRWSRSQFSRLRAIIPCSPRAAEIGSAAGWFGSRAKEGIVRRIIVVFFCFFFFCGRETPRSRPFGNRAKSVIIPTRNSSTRPAVKNLTAHDTPTQHIPPRPHHQP